MKPRIAIDLVGNTWMATFYDNGATEALFGTATLPAAYTSTSSYHEVRAALAEMNPSYFVA